MIMTPIDESEEFLNPNVNYQVLLSKIRAKIISLEEDYTKVQTNDVKAYIYNEILKLRKEYFKLMKVDIELQHLILSNPDIYKQE